jgi:hypothetical protein
MRPITTLAAALLLITSSATGIQQSSPDRPNVVLIMTMPGMPDTAVTAHPTFAHRISTALPGMASSSRISMRMPCHARQHEPDLSPADISNVTESSSCYRRQAFQV